MRLLLFGKIIVWRIRKTAVPFLALPLTGQVRTGCRSLPSWDLSFLICKMRVRAIPDLSSSRHFVTSAKSHPTLTFYSCFKDFWGQISRYFTWSEFTERLL